MKNLQEAIVYWIRLPEHNNIYSDGYVGVTNSGLDARIEQHRKEIFSNVHRNPHLQRAAKKYGWENLVKEIYLVGEETFCYSIENILRPSKKIGWNISPGGHRGPGWPSGKKRPQEWLEAQREKRRPAVEENRKIREEERSARRAARLDKKQARDAELLRNKEEARRLRNEKRAKKQEERAAKEFRKEQSRNKKLEKLQRTLHDLQHDVPKQKQDVPIETAIRPICAACNKNHCAPNYTVNGVRHWRSRCRSCIRSGRKKLPSVPRWQLNGYVKKKTCDLCGFQCSYSSQITVYHIDGNLNNTALSNLRSICLCCVEVVKRRNVIWRRGDLEVDR